jgi:hypothetical protein
MLWIFDTKTFERLQIICEVRKRKHLINVNIIEDVINFNNTINWNVGDVKARAGKNLGLLETPTHQK